MNRKKICWVTPDSFLDTDLDYELISGILKKFDIHWIVLFKQTDNRFKESDFDLLLKENDNLTVEFLYAESRMRSPRNFSYYNRVLKSINRENPDVVYFNVAPHTPYVLPIFCGLPKHKTIIAAHQGEIRYGFRFMQLIRLFRKFAYSNVRFANLFSKTEAERYKSHHPHIHVFQINLGLKDMGMPTNQRPITSDDNPIRFLSFGAIVRAKNIELLIDAACKLYEEGYKNFKVSINGKCDEWSYYESHIKYPEIFETDIRMIPNEDIPNLFNGAHYFVQPYKQVTQSGPMKLAFRYNLPDICSDLPGLTSEIVEGVNGFTFKHENIEDLVKVMKDCIDLHSARYADMRKKMAEYIEQNYSYKVLVDNYTKMFETVIK